MIAHQKPSSSAFSLLISARGVFGEEVEEPAQGLDPLATATAGNADLGVALADEGPARGLAGLVIEDEGRAQRHTLCIAGVWR